MLLTACGSDSSTSPKSAPGVDTVAVDLSTALIAEHWSGSDSGYTSSTVAGDGNFVEVDSYNSMDFDYRALVPFSLPKLSGKGAVDSAKVYQFVCETNGSSSDSIVVDHVSWGAAYLDSALYGGYTLNANIGTFVRSDSLGWRSLNVTSDVQADYAAKRSQSQYRFEYLYSTFPTSYQWIEFDGGYCGNNNQSGDLGGGNGYLVIWSH